MLTRRACVVGLTVCCLLALSGCHGFFTARDDSTNPTPTTTAKFAYVANATSLTSLGAINAYKVNSSNGTLSLVASQSTSPAEPRWVVTDPGGNYLFVCMGPLGIITYQIDRNTGAVGVVSQTELTTNAPTNAVITPNGKFLLAVSQTRGEMYVYQIGSNGVLAQSGVSFSPGTGIFPQGLAVDPAGKVVYVAAGASGTIAYSINNTNGLVSEIQTLAANGSSRAIAITPDGKFAYISNGAGGVDMYTVSSTDGKLSVINGSPASTGGTTATSLAVEPSGKYLYVSNNGSRNVSAFSIGTDGKLTAIAGSPYTVGTEPGSLMVDPSGAFVYVVNEGSGTVSVMQIGTNGGLSSVATTNAALPVSIAVTK